MSELRTPETGSGEMLFVPRYATSAGRSFFSDIYVGDALVGQERVHLGKPWDLDDNGNLIPTEPLYRYYRWDLCVEWDETPVPSPVPLEVSPEHDEDEDGGFRCPGWDSLEGFEKSLKDYPPSITTNVTNDD